MKYKDLLHFEPIQSVIKLTDADTPDIAATLVKNYVFSKKIKEDLTAIILRNLNTTPNYETKGIQIVGSYGTGKSHLMSVVSAIAENENLSDFLSDTTLKEAFSTIAGRYKVLRFEIGNTKPLVEIVFDRLQTWLDQAGVDFQFDPDSKKSWKSQIQEMLAAFEGKYPDAHFLLVIDELLEYLKGRTPNELNNDLMLLRQLGEACDNARFKFMFGVQELLYRSPEFQHQAEMLNKIEDRYQDLNINKDDVSYVVKERLLKKDLHQKQQIRTHLNQFSNLFEGINANLNEYVDLFPVHPAYINYFEKIRHGKSQREILKILSAKFDLLQNETVPEDKPGLITYDSYWHDLADNPSMLTFPDIRAVKDKSEIIAEKINSYFSGPRASKKNLAQSIANALAIRILCDDLDKRNGATAQSLKEDLCITIAGVEDAELLTAAIDNTAKQIISATAGQYVEQNPLNTEFHLRTEGGINISQIVKEYADQAIKREPKTANEYWYDFLQHALGISGPNYRTGFKIWQHSLEWIDKKSFRLGYIFFGNHNERSTTEPIQQFYLFFSPIFSDMERKNGEDEVYFDFSGLSDIFRETICLYGAARAKEGSAPSNQKQLFKNEVETHFKRAAELFEKEFVEATRVIYQNESKPLGAYPLPGAGNTKEFLFSNVAAKVLNPHFNNTFPHYPAFKDLLQPLTKDNFKGRIESALSKILKPQQSNRDGDAILAGLGLWNGTNINRDHSRYADALLERLKKKGDGKVLNRDEVLESLWVNDNLWYAHDFGLEYQLQFVIMAALAFLGDLDIHWSGNKNLSATNINLLNELNEADYFTFQYVKAPQGLPVRPLKALFSGLGLPDFSVELDKPDTIAAIVTRAREMSERCVRVRADVAKGIACRQVLLLPEHETQKIKSELDVLASLLDGVQTYNTFGKLKAFKYTEEELTTAFAAFAHCKDIEKLAERAQKFEKLIGYLYTAQSYVVESDKPLYDDIQREISRLGAVLLPGNEAEIKKYEALLNSLIDQYAEYYLNYYAKCRLSSPDSAIKERLLVSDPRRICDALSEADFINPVEYKNWLGALTSLKPAEPGLTRARVKEEPYQDFNPREYYGKPNFTIRQLEEQLDQILTNWTEALRAVLGDPGMNEKLNLLAPHETALVTGFRDGNMSLTTENAPTLVQILHQLSQGIEKVEINGDELRSRLARPLAPQDMIDTFTEFINEKCKGRERNKVRILLK
jgi:hypothetical protein